MNAKICEVAEKARVSVSTASRVLNGGTKGMRRDAVKRSMKVFRAAEELGYKPNQNARALVMKRTFTIGFIGTEINSPIRSELLKKLRLLTHEKGLQMLVSGVNYEEDITSEVNNLIARRVDGIILGNIHTKNYACLHELHDKKFPLVEFGQDIVGKWDHIKIDYSRMTRELTTHLIEEHGLKKIIFAGYPMIYPRSDGYKRVMNENGISKNIDIWESLEHSMEAGQKLAQKHISKGAKPEAIICHNDLLAIGIIAGLRNCGISVPDDIAVVGLDNIDFANYMHPRLSTSEIDRSQLAVVLFKLLCDQIDGKCDSKPKNIECSSKICIRESCGCNKI